MPFYNLKFKFSQVANNNLRVKMPKALLFPNSSVFIDLYESCNVKIFSNDEIGHF